MTFIRAPFDALWALWRTDPVREMGKADMPRLEEALKLKMM